MTRPILFAIAVLTAGLATPALAQDAMYDPCRSDDLVCRVDRLERTVFQLSERIAEYERAPVSAPVIAAPQPRSVDIPVRSACSGSGCSTVAAETCRTAGFPRGIPAEFRFESGFSYLVRITCMD
jgi:hypothetical protein